MIIRSIPKRAADVLERAAELIERDGWCRKYPGPFNSLERAPRCAIGAINAAEKEFSGVHGAISALKLHLGGFGLSVVTWNDYVARDARDVVLALRTAAQVERYRGWGEVS